MGLWLISIILSIFSSPSIFLNGCVGWLDLFKLLFIAGYKVWLIKVDFPEPETPVTHINFPKGSFKSTSLRLLPEHPEILIDSFESIEPFFLISIFFFPEIYSPVKESLFLINLLKVPEKHTSPPCTPAPGPMSIMWSAASIVSWSCSTTTTVLPKSLSLFSVANSLELSLWCNPIDGSSKMYVTPTRPAPIWLASLILCASPPLKDSALLDKFK